jgi:hypothetical protein
MANCANPKPAAEQAEDESRKRHFAAWRDCDVLYSGWLAARAAMFDPNMPEDADALSERQDKCDAAARALLARPSALPWMIWRKWEVLDDFTTSDTDGPSTDNRTIAALGCIKADILRFGFADPE